MSSSWQQVVISDVAELVRGVTYSKDDSRDTPADNFSPILRATNIQNSRLVLESDLVFVPSGNVSPKQRLRAGDIVMATSSGSKHLVGKSALMRTDWIGSFGAFCAALRAKQNIDPHYLSAFLQSPAYWSQVTKKALGVNINNLRRGDIETLELPLPDLDEQREIVAELEKQFSRLDEAVASLKRVKANLKRYKASVLKDAVEGRLVPTEAELARREGRSYETGAQLLQRILETRRSQWQGKGKYKEPAAPVTTSLPVLPEGWVWTNFEQVTDRVTKGSSPNWQGFEYCDKGIPFVRSQNVGWGVTDLSDIAFLPPAFNEVEKKSVLREGDVLLNIVGASIGRAAIAPSNVEGGNVNQAVAVIRLLESGVSNQFVLLYLLSSQTQHRIHTGKVDVARANFSLSDIKGMPLALPPGTEQQRIVAEIDKRLTLVGAVNAQVDANLKRAERLRQSILGTAFSGRLVPQDPNTQPASVLLSRIRTENAIVKAVAPSRTSKAQKAEEEIIMTDLVEVLSSAGGWITAQEAFRRCGVADGSDTDAIEHLYAELRDHIKPGVIQIERRGTEDWLRLSQSKGV